MDWSASEIRQLRYRLGWSQAEMARRMNSDLTTISGWEAGDAAPELGHCNTLLSILAQADSAAERVQRRPLAEMMMREQGLSQIHDFDVLTNYDASAGRVVALKR